MWTHGGRPFVMAQQAPQNSVCRCKLDRYHRTMSWVAIDSWGPNSWWAACCLVQRAGRVMDEDDHYDDYDDTLHTTGGGFIEFINYMFVLPSSHHPSNPQHSFRPVATAWPITRGLLGRCSNLQMVSSSFVAMSSLQRPVCQGKGVYLWCFWISHFSLVATKESPRDRYWQNMAKLPERQLYIRYLYTVYICI